MMINISICSNGDAPMSVPENAIAADQATNCMPSMATSRCTLITAHMHVPALTRNKQSRSSASALCQSAAHSASLRTWEKFLERPTAKNTRLKDINTKTNVSPLGRLGLCVHNFVDAISTWIIMITVAVVRKMTHCARGSSLLISNGAANGSASRCCSLLTMPCTRMPLEKAPRTENATTRNADTSDRATNSASIAASLKRKS
mmetsp:Transcript_10563/g.30670  ORF Transcript_10563/g.30670 Transcript_10563/m.30670 type:complete len:203 (-) Transcript_10563:14-622(-)